MGNREVFVTSLLPFHYYLSLCSLPDGRRVLENPQRYNTKKTRTFLEKVRVFHLIKMGIHDSHS